MSMNRNQRKPSLSVIIFILAGLLCVVPMPAPAAGPAFTGLAAKADTAETVYLNPAGMSRMNESAWYGNVMVMYTESGTEFSIPGQPNTQNVEDDGFIFLPGLYYVRPLNERWAVGIGPNAATGLGTTYNDTWPGRYLIQEWSLIFVGIVPSVSYRFNEKFSLGLSLSVNYSMFSMEKALLDPGQPGDGKFELEADGVGIGGNLGLLYEVNDKTRFGVVYRSEVKADNEGTPDISGLSPDTKNPLANSGAFNQEISMDTIMPQSLLAGIFHDFDNGWTVSADILWVDFSSYDIDNISIGSTTITKDSTAYQDIWAFSIGPTYDLTKDWALRGGFLYVSSGLEAKDRTAFSRYDAFWAIGAGVEYAFTEKRRLAVDINYFQFGDGDFTATDVPIVGSISGTYDSNYGIALAVAYSW